MYGIEVTWSWIIAAFFLSFILSVATPPVMGGTTVCFSILFSQLGLNSQALAMIISIYVLLNKEVLVGVSKKLLYSFFKRERANAIVRGARYADKVFGGFISGKLIDSFIIGIICYIVMIIFKWDYPVLISIIIGVTNIIPFFGPLIGAVPSTLLLLMVKPSEGLFFVIFVLALQQLDGNIIGPIILGDRLKLNSMWILFAILVGGGLFGVPGMILGAPCFACLYALVGTACRATLAKREMPVDAKDYVYLDQMEEK
jgi:predicted PurR-regulated permease PerM